MKGSGALHCGARKITRPHFAREDDTEPCGVEVFEAMEETELRLRYPGPNCRGFDARLLSKQALHAIASSLHPPHQDSGRYANAEYEASAELLDEDSLDLAIAAGNNSAGKNGNRQEV